MNAHAHAHDHHHGHHHVPAPALGDRRYTIAIALNLAFVVIEAGAGFVANSTALLADAAHNLSDVLGLALAGGATTYKLKYGHRGYNQPVLKVGTNHAYITSQNHGFAVDLDKLKGDYLPYFVNLNDNTCEGIQHKSKPIFATQFHPEASGGPTDTAFLFQQFISNIEKTK